MSDLLVNMVGIEKSFPGVHALSNCHFELRSGEVHALVGENGAGKSTLMKILAGVYQKDAGQVLVHGKEVEIHNPREALQHGIAMIHQELNLVPHLSVAQNIYIGREPRAGLPFWLDERKINADATQLLASMHLPFDPKTRVANLSVAQQQMVEIAKALSMDAEVLIMDEPTAALTESEIEELFRIIRQLKKQGVGIVYISHRLEELKIITDRVTVMRDGQYIATGETAETSVDQIISWMVGRTIFESSPELPKDANQPIVLEVRNLNRGKALKEINFAVKRGEIVGFAGLMGAGRTEVARAIFGADKIDSGEILRNGVPVRIHSPQDAVRHGIGYLSEDRKRYGLLVGLNVETNIVIAAYNRFLRWLGVVDGGGTRAVADKYVQALSIKTPSTGQLVRNLSGGNQQKVVIGKWLTADTDILIFDEPTRGIDVGAKSEIYKLLNELVAQGKSVIMISSELPEVLRMSHRIIVMCEGRITGELSAGEADQERIMRLATQRTQAVVTN